MIDKNTKLSDLTVGELLEILGGGIQPRRIHGVEGLAEYLGCSKRTAQRIKSSGAIDKAIIQQGRTVVFDEKILRTLLRV